MPLGRAALVWAAAMVVVLPCAAEPVEQSDGLDEPEVATAWEEPLPDDDDSDPHAAAESAAVDAVIEHQAALDRHAVMLQTYLGRPPTWIQTAARVNLGEFPGHADPTADADRELRTLEWLVAQRNREPRGTPSADEMADASAPTADVPTWVEPLLPSTWLPLLREHRDEVVVIGAALLVASWLMNRLTPLMLRAWRRRHRRHRRPRGHGGRSSRRHRDGSTSPSAQSPDELRREAALAAERAMRPRSRHRRRHRHGHQASGSAP